MERYTYVSYMCYGHEVITPQGKQGKVSEHCQCHRAGALVCYVVQCSSTPLNAKLAVTMAVTLNCAGLADSPHIFQEHHKIFRDASIY